MNEYEVPELTFKTHACKVEQFQAIRRLSPHDFDLVTDVSWRIEEVTKDLVVQCKMWIASKEMQNETKVVFDDKYASLWDHFKAVALPTFTRWFKLNVNYVRTSCEVTFKRKALLPDIPLDDRNIREGRVIIKEMVETSPNKRQRICTKE